jgi:pimeloyl-ACP methyl ester carboxylesterase
MAPRIRFVRSPRGHRLAVAIDGSGPTLVLPAWWVSHVERDFANPAFRDFVSALARHFTVVRYDRAGVGLSDRERTEFTLEGEVADLEAVIDDHGSQRVALFAVSCGAPPAIALAARRPALIERLVVFGGYLHGATIGRLEVQKALVALVRASWGLGSKALCDIFIPGASPQAAQRFIEDQREFATSDMSARLLELTYASDVRAIAAGVRAPTLVLHRRDDRAIAFDHGREVAAAIPKAELVALEGTEHLPWLGDAAAALAALGIAPLAPASGPAPSEVVHTEVESELRRDGDVWTVRFSGRTVHAKHALGLADLAMLVAHPGRRFPAIELMRGATDLAVAADGADAVLDDNARRQFRTRLCAIDAALAEAGASSEQIARLEAERDALLSELRSAIGLGGRRRRLGDDAERARKAVSGRIRDCIARLSGLHPELGQHLGRSIETGSTCVYAPSAAMRWRT